MEAALRNYTLRDDLVIRRRIFSGAVTYVVKDPLRLEYCTVDEVSYTLLQLADGSRGIKELSESAERLFPGMGFSALTLMQFYENYRKFHFFEDRWETNILMIERQRTNRMRALQKAVANPLEIHLPAWNPDRFFGAIVKPLGFLFTWKALAVYAVIILAAIWISVSNARDFALGFGELFVIQGKAILGIVVLWFILLFTVVLHEIGHGLTCKHFGGGVYKIGFLFLYFNPCMYCDVTEAYFFEDKRQKHAVTLAGGIVDLLTAAIATFIWWFTPHDLFVSEVAHRVALFNGVSGILVNFNPLMKYDGYYLLSDELEIPNLRGDSFRFLGNRVREMCGLPFQEELLTRKQKRVFWIYGVLGVIYSFVVLWFVLQVVGGFLIGKFQAIGYLLTLGLLVLFTKRYVRNTVGFARFFALDKAAHFRKWGAMYGLLAAVLVVTFFLLPVPRHVKGTFAFAPGREAVLYAPEAGVIEEVAGDEGDAVAEGTVPVRLRSDQLRLRRLGAETRIVAARAERSSGQARGDAGLAAVGQAGLREGMAMESFYRGREATLSPLAPFDGVILTPDLPTRGGMALVAGDTLCVLGDLSTVLAEVVIDEQDLGYLDSGAGVEVRLHADPSRAYPGTVELIAPASSGGRFRKLYRVLVRVPNPDGSLRPGMSGVARFEAGRATSFQHVMDRMAKLFRIQFWI